MSDQIKELVVKLRDTIMTSRGLGQSDEELVNPDGPEAADALEALAGEVALLREAMMEIDPHLDEDTEAVQRFRKALEATKWATTKKSEK